MMSASMFNLNKSELMYMFKMSNYGAPPDDIVQEL